MFWSSQEQFLSLPADPEGGKSSRKGRATAVEHTFFLMYVANAICSQLVYVASLDVGHVQV